MAGSTDRLSPQAFIAGSIAGAAGIFVGHPLDTLKTFAQTGRKRPDSVLSLFRGIHLQALVAGSIQSLHLGVWAAANVVVWAVMFPVETVRNVQQGEAARTLVAGSSSERQLPQQHCQHAPRGAIACARNLVREAGVRLAGAGAEEREKKRRKKKQGKTGSGVCPTPCPSYLLYLFYAGFYERNLPRENYTTRGQCAITHKSVSICVMSVKQ